MFLPSLEPSRGCCSAACRTSSSIFLHSTPNGGLEHVVEVPPVQVVGREGVAKDDVADFLPFDKRVRLADGVRLGVRELATFGDDLAGGIQGANRTEYHCARSSVRSAGGQTLGACDGCSAVTGDGRLPPSS